MSLICLLLYQSQGSKFCYEQWEPVGHSDFELWVPNSNFGCPTLRNRIFIKCLAVFLEDCVYFSHSHDVYLDVCDCQISKPMYATSCEFSDALFFSFLSSYSLVFSFLFSVFSSVCSVLLFSDVPPQKLSRLLWLFMFDSHRSTHFLKPFSSHKTRVFSRYMLFLARARNQYKLCIWMVPLPSPHPI